MYTNFNMPIINEMCPESMTEHNCPLREYIKSGQDTFNVSINENHLVPKDANDIIKIAATICEMRKICNKCQEANNQKAR